MALTQQNKLSYASLFEMKGHFIRIITHVFLPIMCDCDGDARLKNIPIRTSVEG